MVSVNIRPSARRRGKSSRSTSLAGTDHASGRAGRSRHSASRRPSPARVSEVASSILILGMAASIATTLPPVAGSLKLPAMAARAAAATSTNAASIQRRRQT
jgi:hypothetical protein